MHHALAIRQNVEAQLQFLRRIDVIDVEVDLGVLNPVNDSPVEPSERVLDVEAGVGIGPGLREVDFVNEGQKFEVIEVLIQIF